MAFPDFRGSKCVFVEFDNGKGLHLVKLTNKFARNISRNYKIFSRKPLYIFMKPWYDKDNKETQTR